MKVAIVTRGKFNDFAKPTTNTNMLPFRVLAEGLHAVGAETVNIGFGKTCGADRILDLCGLGDVNYNATTFRTKTQQHVTLNICDANARLFDDIGAVIMNYFTFFGQRGNFFPVAYICAEMGIPLLLWDTDANFLGEMGLSNPPETAVAAAMKVFGNPTYANSYYVAPEVLEDMMFAVLSPSSAVPAWVDRFDFFRIFERQQMYSYLAKKYDVVYAGSQYQREEKFRKYYDVADETYTTAVYGKYSNDFLDTLETRPNKFSRFKGQVPMEQVQQVLSEGRCCVQIARQIYEKIGHITPRVLEAVQSGTPVLIDDGILNAGWVYGTRCLVSGPDHVAALVSRGDRFMSELWDEQAHSAFFREATAENRANQILNIIDRLKREHNT